MGARKLNVVVDEQDIHDLSMKAIEVRAELFQTRAAVDPEVVQAMAELIRNGMVKALPPVQVCHVRNTERYILADGFHRHAAHLKQRKGSIRAMVYEIDEPREALLRGIEANLDPKTMRVPKDKDRQHAAEMMIRDEEFRTWNDREICRRCGISNTLMRRLRLELHQSEGIPLPERVKKFLPNGKCIWVLYRTSGTVGQPAITTRPGSTPLTRKRHCALLDGKTVTLSSDLEEAKTRITDFLENIEAIRAILAQTAHFRSWLETRGIFTEPAYNKEPALGNCLITQQIALVPCGTDDHDGVARCLATALLVCKVFDSIDRILVVGFRHGLSGRTSRMLTLAARVPNPIEFLSPEEVVAEFAIKPEGEAT
jgi:hypothetical protein